MISSTALRRSGRHCRNKHAAAGFTYLGLLILLAMITLTSTAAIQVGAILQRRDAEEELLEIGNEFQRALASYAAATPAGQKKAPAKLEDLLADNRYPKPRRHLRRLYPDPITGREEWGIVMAPDSSGIVGIHSLSDAVPIKQANFPPPFAHFMDKSSYRLWVFANVN